MRKINYALAIVIVMSLFSCKRDMVTYHLNKGLEELQHSRPIKEKFIDGYEIQKVGFFKISNDSCKVALLLNDDIKKNVVESYTLGMHIKTDDKSYIANGKKFRSLDSPVSLQDFNGNKYIIRTIQTPKKRIKSIMFFLYNLGKFKKSTGRNIVIKNIGL